MKKLLLIVLIIKLCGISSCIIEDPEMFNRIWYRNNSTERVVVTRYTSRQIQSVDTLNPQETIQVNEYFFHGFAGDSSIDSVRFVFLDGTGWVCDAIANTAPENCCFNSMKTPFGPPSDFIQRGDGHYEFVITEEDRLNAKVLE